MRREAVEIYSDETNKAVLRHPGRRFPGMLIQGDNLYALYQSADQACAAVGRGSPGFDECKRLRNSLWGYLTHYKTVLSEHDIQLPFSESPAT